MKTTINLIDAKSSDIQITYQIMCNSIKPYIDKLWNWDETQHQKIHRKNFKASKISLIEFQEKTVGYLAITEDDEEIYIDNLMIDKQFQNLGIGKEVMQRLIQKSSLENKIIRLQVFKINTKAQKFYQDLEFEKTSESEFNFEMKRYFL